MFQKIGLKISTNKSARLQRTSEMVPLSKAKSIGVLVADLNDTRQAIDFLKKELEPLGVRVSLIALNNRREKISGHVVEHEVGKKDFTWVGKDKTGSIKKIEKTNFDYLFCLNTSTTLPFEYILSKSGAKCRVGISHENIKPYLYDLVVDAGDKKDWLSISKEVLNCIKMLKSN